jgi:monothiol glutaredoxin
MPLNKVDDTNQPLKVRPLSAQEAKAMLDRGELTLFDVRPQGERALASIAAARSLDAGGQEYLAGLDRQTPIAFHCHHGVRSRVVAEQALRAGFQTVYNLEGGIAAWSATVDPSVPRY